MNEPNLSIIVPGGCNSKCDFCFWKQQKPCDNYYDFLETTLASLPEEFNQISLTGGEPCLSKYLIDILYLIDRKKFKKVILTSNGTGLYKFIFDNDPHNNLKSYIDHINISRHHYNDVINETIFHNTSTIKIPELKKCIKIIHQNKIDVTFNCVLTDNLQSKEDILKYIKFAKSLKVDAISFRKQHGTIEASPQELLFYKGYITVGESSCPVCRTKAQYIDDMLVYWKNSSVEPSTELNELYEAVIHPEGKITLDWEGKIPMTISSPKDTALKLIAEALISIGQQLKNLVDEPTPVVKKVKKPNIDPEYKVDEDDDQFFDFSELKKEKTAKAKVVVDKIKKDKDYRPCYGGGIC